MVVGGRVDVNGVCWVFGGNVVGCGEVVVFIKEDNLFFGQGIVLFCEVDVYGYGFFYCQAIWYGSGDYRLFGWYLYVYICVMFRSDYFGLGCVLCIEMRGDIRCNVVCYIV